MGNRLLSLEKKLFGAGLSPKASMAKSVGLTYWSQPMGYAFTDGMHRMELTKPTGQSGKASRSRWMDKGVETAQATSFKAKLIEHKKTAYDVSKSNLDLFKANIYAILDTLDVENTAIYQPKSSSTYCNVYAYDVITGLGAYLPRMWWTPDVEKKMISGLLTPDTVHKTVKKPYKEIYGESVSLEQTANMLNTWFERIGEPYFGWEKAADMDVAQQAANSGHIVIINAAKTGSHGHISIVLPELPNSPARKAGVPLQSQAGATNFKIGSGGKWWSDSKHSNGHAWIYKGEIKSPIIASGVALGGAYA